jgi:hypothetical protein
MATDPRLFFKLHNGFPEHPKAFELSDKAFRQLIEAWCYCSRNLNDGKLSKAQFFKLFSAKSRKEVMTVGFVVESENGYEMHDYLEHQQSAEQVETRRTKRAAAGSMGGRAKANGVASASSHAKQTGSKSVADTDTDTDEEAKASSSPAKRGTRIPNDFAVAPAMVAWARANTPTVDGQRETLKFINYWQAKAGRDGVKLDWPATWRNWMLNAAERAPQGKPTTSDKMRSTLEIGRRLQAVQDGTQDQLAIG